MVRYPGEGAAEEAPVELEPGGDDAHVIPMHTLTPPWAWPGKVTATIPPAGDATTAAGQRKALETTAL